jgi:hypothetical protein
LDFFTAHDEPVAITIDGTPYSVPLLRNPGLKKWSAIQREKYADAAGDSFKDKDGNVDQERKARFLTYAPAPPIDIAEMMISAVSPEGAEFIVDIQLEAAGVPAEVRKKFVENVYPDDLRAFASRLARRSETLGKMGVKPEEQRTDPLPGSPSESEGSPGTSTPSDAASPPSTET